MTEGDWRLNFQERYLKGAALEWKRYRAWSRTWDHDHCEFCGAKFSEDQPDALREGYTTTGEHANGAEYHWICRGCFDDFAELFEWRVVA